MEVIAGIYTHTAGFLTGSRLAHSPLAVPGSLTRVITVAAVVRVWAAAIARWRPKRKPKARLSLEFFQQQGRRGGKASARTRMEKLTPEERSGSARRAAIAKWARW